MHTFRSIPFLQINDPPVSSSDVSTTQSPPVDNPAIEGGEPTIATVSPPLSPSTQPTNSLPDPDKTISPVSSSPRSRNSLFTSKKVSSPSTTVPSLPPPPASFLARLKKASSPSKFSGTEVAPEAFPNPSATTTTTTPNDVVILGGSSNEKGVNPNKGIMTLKDDAVLQLPKRKSIDTSPTASPISSNNTTPTSSPSFLSRLRSPSLRTYNKVSSASDHRGSILRRHSSTPALMIGNSNTGDTDMQPDNMEQYDDPVLALFTSRNTQKVRFSLGEVEPRDLSNRMDSTTPVNSDQTTKTSLSSLKQSNRKESRKATINHASTTTSNVNDSGSSNSKFNIKKFMKGAIFGGGSKKGGNNNPSSEFELEFEREMEEATRNCNNEMIWSTQEDGIPEVLRTTAKSSSATAAKHPYNMNGSHKNTNDSNASVDGSTAVKVSFAENYETRATIIKLINKARRAQFIHFRYEYAVKCYVKALEILRSENYPEDHPTVIKTIKLLQGAHETNRSYTDSANIVKLGIKYEDSGELVRALKMYTIAYRIRSEALGPNHPSLVVLLNMLGSVQIKCGELDEAMAIYELALKDTEPPKSSSGNGSSSGDDNNSMSSNTITSPSDGQRIRTTNYVTRAVTYREMGTIYEQWGEPDRALQMYHKSLDCMAEYKGLCKQSTSSPSSFWNDEKKECDDVIFEVPSSSHDEMVHDLESTYLSTAAVAPRSAVGASLQQDVSKKKVKEKDRFGSKDLEDRTEDGGMELTIGESNQKRGRRGANKASAHVLSSRYDVFFPPSLDDAKRKNRLSVGSNSHKRNDEKLGDHTDVDVALTIHRIAQLHRAQQEYDLALPAFFVSLRGMKYALGKSHPNVAAILGNIGNLQKEMGDMDSAYTTYQQVLAIESYRLGLSHPDVVVTLHNISTIDAARGNHEHALSLYTQVVTLQRKLFGEDHESVAVTSACMGDVYERLGDIKSAVDCYEEALRIKIGALGRHSLEVARLLHKLGKLAISEEDFHLAHSYISKALLVYRLNKLRDDDEWVIDVNRDAADVDAAIAMGRGGEIFEC